MIGTIGLGLILGVMAGYFRGWVDEVIMRTVDVMLLFPLTNHDFGGCCAFGR